MKTSILKVILPSIFVISVLSTATPASAALLLNFGFEVPPNTLTSYSPDTNNLTGTSPVPLLTRPSGGAFNYNSDGWTGGSGNTLAYGGSNPLQFTLGFDATGFTDFSIDFGYINESATSYNFDSVQYRVGGSGGFTTISGSPLTLTGSGAGSGPGFNYSLDLSVLSAIENVSNVEIFFNGTSNVPDTIKVDNLVLNGTAVLEPSTYVLLVTGLGLFIVMRRRSAALALK